MSKVVFAVGRFNPATKGHKLLIDTVLEKAREYKADAYIFTTRSQDAKKNPLNVEQKLHYLRQFFPGVKFLDTQNPYIAAQTLGEWGYDDGIMVAGADRAPTFEEMIRSGIAHKGDPLRWIPLKSIEMVTLERDPDADDVSGLSATEAREAAKENNFERFSEIVPEANEQTKHNLFQDVREGLRID